MITLHHLNKSRSKRIIWLLEELEQPYEIAAYQRDATTFLAPPELKAVHPLGKSPVLEIDGKVLAESGAITEYLIHRYAPDTLAPAKDSPEYADYLYWMHFAESSAMLPLLLVTFLKREPAKTEFLESYANSEAANILGYINQCLEGKNYLVGDSLTGADIMMSFVTDVLAQQGVIENFPNIAVYHQTLSARPAYQTAEKTEKAHN
ncbi:glutathione S-transferase family protein [Veronia pacifica]|uniref:glutathione transferase n=1 Tax=Veronia pacifica TaxID=1080227 RepID=A0A1C3ES46_9GAMM|nr:glutathione S-transferase [Veronia pacifica]ODA36089.1 glutathione S-transferase [Veronia pacifica]